MAADTGVIPIGNIDGSIRTDGDVGRTEQDALIRLGGGVRFEPMEVGAFEFAGRVRVNEVPARVDVEGEGALLRDELVSEDRVTRGFAIQERTFPCGAKGAVLVDRDAGGRALRRRRHRRPWYQDRPGASARAASTGRGA